MKNSKKLISVLLVAMLLITTVAATGITASAAGGTLASYYKTNPDNKFGKQATTDVNVISNYFGSSSVSDLKVGDTFTAVYELNSNTGVASAMWKLAYDSSMLRLKTDASAICPSGGYVKTGINPVKGNFTSADPLLDFNGGKTFVQAEFEVLATGSTNVNLIVEELTLGSKSGNTMNLACIVENSQIQNITGQTGFANASVTATSQASTGGDISDTITVNAASNFFAGSAGTFEAGANKVSVAYRLKSNMGLVNAQWSLRYDTNKLAYNSVTMPKATGAYFDFPATGVITGNFSSLDMISYSSMDDFVVVTFNVIGTGDTTVTLNVMNLAVGYKSGGVVTEGYLVDNGTVKNLKNTTGFTSLTYSTESRVTEDDLLLGDVNSDGKVNVNDVTALQRYLAEYTTLTSAQLRAADVDRNGKVNVNDLTNIQRKVAGYNVF